MQLSLSDELASDCVFSTCASVLALRPAQIMYTWIERNMRGRERKEKEEEEGRRSRHVEL